MADRKISDLTALTTPASGDFLPIVDISEAAAATKNKRITIEELMRGMPDGTAAAPGIAFENDPNTGIYSPGADQVAIGTGGSERARIDSSGRLLVGTSTARTSANGVSAGLQVEGTGGESALSIIRNGGLPYLTLGRSGGASVGSNTAISNNDELGRISWAAADGTDIQSWAAQISAEIDGTPGSNDTPGRLVFSTTADGAASPTERMRIKSNGTINFSNVATYADNTAALAGGLVAGDVYRKSDGTLMIAY